MISKPVLRLVLFVAHCLFTTGPEKTPEKVIHKVIHRPPGGFPRLLAKLEVVELVVNAALGQQLLVAARLRNPAVVQHKDHVRVPHGGKAVGDADRRPPFHQFVQVRLHRPLGFVVKRTRGFVQDQDGRVLQNGPGDGNALPLPAGKGHAFLADPRLVAARLLHYELVRVSVFGRLLHFGGGGLVRASIGQTQKARWLQSHVAKLLRKSLGVGD
jgi:hypothetical protein